MPGACDDVWPDEKASNFPKTTRPPPGRKVPICRYGAGRSRPADRIRSSSARQPMPTGGHSACGIRTAELNWTPVFREPSTCCWKVSVTASGGPCITEKGIASLSITRSGYRPGGVRRIRAQRTGSKKWSFEDEPCAVSVTCYKYLQCPEGDMYPIFLFAVAGNVFWSKSESSTMNTTPCTAFTTTRVS